MSAFSSAPTALDGVKNCGLFQEEYQMKAVVDILSKLNLLAEKNIYFKKSLEASYNYYIFRPNGYQEYMYRIHICPHPCGEPSILTLYMADQILAKTESFDYIHRAVDGHNLIADVAKFNIGSDTICHHDSKIQTYYFWQPQPVEFGFAKFLVVNPKSSFNYWPSTNDKTEFANQVRFSEEVVTSTITNENNRYVYDGVWIARLNILHLMFLNPEVIPKLKENERIREIQNVSNTGFTFVYSLPNKTTKFQEFQIVDSDKIVVKAPSADRLNPSNGIPKFSNIPSRDALVKEYLPVLETKLENRIQTAKKENNYKICIQVSEHYDSPLVIEWIKEMCLDRKFKFSYGGTGCGIFIHLLG